MATHFEKMVYTIKPKKKYVKLKVGFGGIIRLNGFSTGYKIGKDNCIYTKNGDFVSKDAVEDFIRSQGLIE